MSTFRKPGHLVSVPSEPEELMEQFRQDLRAGLQDIIQEEERNFAAWVNQHCPANTSSTPTPESPTSSPPTPQITSESNNPASSSGETTPESSKNGKPVVSLSNRRIRVNVSRTTKGAVSFEATVEMQDASMETVLAESDRLVAELAARYPAQGKE